MEVTSQGSYRIAKACECSDGADKMAQLVRAFTTHPDDPSSIPGPAL